MPTYPVIYDWIAVVVLSIVLLIFVGKYSFKHPGLVAFLVAQLIILPLYVSWDNIFTASIAERVLSTQQQIYALAPTVSFVVISIGNVLLNFTSREKRGYG